MAAKITRRGRGREIFVAFLPLLGLLTSIMKQFPTPVRRALGPLLRNIPGYLGLGLRYSWLASIAEQVGRNVAIFPGVYIFAPEKLKIGSNVSIHPMCYIDATGEIEIEDDVSIAHSVTILSTTHIVGNGKSTIKDSGYRLRRTTVCQGVWIGAKASLLLGVTVGHDAVVGTHTLVNKDVLPGSVVGGVPARVIQTHD